LQSGCLSVCLYFFLLSFLRCLCACVCVFVCFRVCLCVWACVTYPRVAIAGPCTLHTSLHTLLHTLIRTTHSISRNIPRNSLLNTYRGHFPRPVEANKTRQRLPHFQSQLPSCPPQILIEDIFPDRSGRKKRDNGSRVSNLSSPLAPLRDNVACVSMGGFGGRKKNATFCSRYSPRRQ
jgi:hypothetical protein